MKKILLSAVAALALTLGLAATGEACDSKGCECAKAAKLAADQAANTDVQLVSLEGKVEPFGCEIRAAKMNCTGAALVVGEQKHLIRKGKKGVELVRKAKGSDRLVKVTARKQGEFITVSKYEIKS